MPEEESQQNQEVQEKPQAGGFLSARGWVMVALSNVLWIVFVLVLMYLEGARPKETREAGEEGLPAESLDNYNTQTHHIPKLDYSLRMPTGSPAILHMEVLIVLGRTPEERQRDLKVLDEDWAKFRKALSAMEPKIRDSLMTYISQQSKSQLETAGGREKIKAYIKTYVNDELKNIDMELKSRENMRRDRVTDIFIPVFFIQ